MKTKTAAKKKSLVATKAKPKILGKKNPVAAKTAKRKLASPALTVIRGGGDSKRGLYVRFGTEKDGLGPSIKAKVKAAADKCGATMNGYIVASVLDWVAQGKTPTANEALPMAAVI